MRSLIAPFAISMALIHQVTAFSYWVDKSCTGDKDMTEIIKETQDMAAKTLTRLNSDSDHDFANVYEYLFKRKKSDKDSLDTIKRYYSDVEKMNKIDDQKAANVRIYCDNDARWVERKDPKTKQPIGGFEDESNWLSYSGRKKGCEDRYPFSTERTTWAEMYRDYMPGDPPQKQADPRVSITICDKTFFNDPTATPMVKKKGLLMSGLKKELDLTKIASVDLLCLQASKILLHELSHQKAYDTIDNAYFWTPKPRWNGPFIHDISAADLMKNADVRAYLGQFALLADKGYTLDRPPADNAPKEEKDKHDKMMKDGKLVLLPNTSKKRSIPRREDREARRHVSIEARADKM